MREASSLAGQKRERAGAPRGVSPAQRRPALQRIAAAREACQRLRGRPYAIALNELADALLRIFSARLVVVRDGARGDAVGSAPTGVNGRDWLEIVAQLDGTGDALRVSDGEAARIASVPSSREAWPRTSGVEQLVIVPLDLVHGRGSLLIGLPEKDALGQDDLTCLDVISELVALTFERLELEAADESPASRAQGNTLPEIVSIAAHELRTPLTPITMLLQALERKARSGTIDLDAILRTRRQVTRLAQMISDLLDLTRLREGRLELARARIDLDVCWAQVVTKARDNYPKHKIELTATGGPHYVIGDEDRILEASSSLLDHVARSLPSGGAIHIDLERRDKRALVSVIGERRPLIPEIPREPAQPADRMPPAIAVLLARAVWVHFGGEMSIADFHERGPTVTASLPVAVHETE